MARTNTLGNFLTDVATAIKTKKGDNTPILASDFDTEITNLPSGSEGIYKVETIEELPTNAEENDLCVVYGTTTANFTMQTLTDTIILPETVTFTTAIDDFYTMSLTGTGGREGIVEVSLTQTSCNVRINPVGGSTIDVSYTSEDGLTYITSNPQIVNIGVEVYVEEAYSYDEHCANFIKITVIDFGGLYAYDGTNWSYADIGISLNQDDLISNKKAYTSGGTITGTLPSVVNQDNLKRVEGILDILYEKSETAGLTSLNQMFYMSDIKYAEVLRHLNTSNVTSCNQIFYNCTSLLEVPMFDTSNCTSFQYAFAYCRGITSFPQLNFSNATNLSRTFEGCSSLTTLPQLDFSSATNMEGMFSGCSSLTTLPTIDISNVTTTRQMFSSCSSLTSATFSASSMVEDTGYMFSGCSSLTSVGMFDTSNCTNFSRMFENCSSLIDVPTYATALATSLTYMFNGCTNLSEDSLNNILVMCANATKIRSGDKKLKTVGLTSTQANICKGLSNYQAFLNAGWTTGY